MLAIDVLATARRRGIDGDTPLARPREAISEELRAAIRQHKPELYHRLTDV